jgi:hypothetical protein
MSEADPPGARLMPTFAQAARISALLVCSMALLCAPASAVARATLGSPALARQSGTLGLGRVAPHSFDAGGFPIYDSLRWTGWGSRSAFALGRNAPDGGPGPGARVEVRAFDLGGCDSMQDIYRRIDIRQYEQSDWGRWKPFVPYSARGAPGFRLCLDAVERRCAIKQAGRRQHLVAYNIGCGLATRYWRKIPSDWRGADVDDTAGGHAVIYPDGEQDTVRYATHPNGTLSLSGLAGATVVWERVDVGE